MNEIYGIQLSRYSNLLTLLLFDVDNEIGSISNLKGRVFIGYDDYNYISRISDITEDSITKHCMMYKFSTKDKLDEFIKFYNIEMFNDYKEFMIILKMHL